MHFYGERRPFAHRRKGEREEADGKKGTTTVYMDVVTHPRREAKRRSMSVAKQRQSLQKRKH